MSERTPRIIPENVQEAATRPPSFAERLRAPLINLLRRPSTYFIILPGYVFGGLLLATAPSYSEIFNGTAYGLMVLAATTGMTVLHAVTPVERKVK